MSTDDMARTLKAIEMSAWDHLCEQIDRLAVQRGISYREMVPLVYTHLDPGFAEAYEDWVDQGERE